MVTPEERPSEGLRLAIARRYLARFPDALRKKLQDDSELQSQLGLGVRTVVSFADSSFSADELMNAINEAARVSDGCPLAALDGSDWWISIARGARKILLAREGEQAELPFAWSMVSFGDEALGEFSRAAEHYELEVDRCERWARVLKERSLLADEYFEMLDDLIKSPASIEHVIAEKIRGGRVSIQDLVPAEDDYFFRRLGASDASVSEELFLGRILPKQAARFLREGCLASVRRTLSLCCGVGFASAVEWPDWVYELLQREIFDGSYIPTILDLGTLSILLWCGAGDTVLELNADAALSLEVSLDEHYLDESRLLFVMYSLVLGELEERHTFGFGPSFAARLVSMSHALFLVQEFSRSGADLVAVAEAFSGAKETSFYAFGLAGRAVGNGWCPSEWSPAAAQWFLASQVWIAATEEALPVDPSVLSDQATGVGIRLGDEFLASIDKIPGRVPLPTSGWQGLRRSLVPEERNAMAKVLDGGATRESVLHVVFTSRFAELEREWLESLAESLERVGENLSSEDGSLVSAADALVLGRMLSLLAYSEKSERLADSATKISRMAFWSSQEDDDALAYSLDSQLIAASATTSFECWIGRSAKVFEWVSRSARSKSECELGHGLLVAFAQVSASLRARCTDSLARLALGALRM